jgi:hypothetical protein
MIFRWRPAAVPVLGRPVHTRIVEEEWLDRLPPDDPAARRSRADLRRINRVMGNDRWILRELAHFKQAASRGIAELGAGDGDLACRIAAAFPASRVLAYDLAPRPAIAGLPRPGGGIEWHSGDALEQPPPSAGILIANLFLHHFEGEDLLRLGRWCAGFDVLLFNEPDRARLPLLLAALAWPWIHPVTRNDMPVSIRAGFREGEIATLMGLDERHWEIREFSTLCGARRLIACRARDDDGAPSPFQP